MVSTLLINQMDNVVVAVHPVKKGSMVDAVAGQIVVQQDIDQGHKIAIRDIKQGENIIKYGFPIGHAVCDIHKGDVYKRQLYNTAFDDQDKPTFSYYRERIVKNHKGFLWQGAIHEVIVPRGNIVYSQAAVSHKKLHPGDPMRNLRIFETMLQKGQPLDARQRFYYARELFYHKRYEQAIYELTAFLEEGRGWVENNIEACITLYDCYMALNQESKALKSLFYSFCYDKPRAEVCCKAGEYMANKQRLSLIHIFCGECMLTFQGHKPIMVTQRI